MKLPPPIRRANVKSHEYNPVTHNLDVTFHTGRVYRYAGVQKSVATKFARAESLGSYLHEHIIPKHHATELHPLTKLPKRD